MDYLCEACSTLFSDGSLDRYAISPDVGYVDKRPTVWHAHHLSAAAHQSALSRGCVPCSWIPVPHQGEYGTFFCIIERRGQILLGQPRRQYSPEVRTGLRSQGTAQTDISQFVTIDIVAHGDAIVHNQLATLSSISRCKSNTGQPEVLHLAKGWLTHCFESHQHCQRPGLAVPTRPPRRLLHLSTTSAKLVDTTRHFVSGPYATLSHCWGGMPSLVLTSQTMASLEKGLTFLDFDPTFHDAMVTTKALGIEYLWIDCFCIIQGTNDASREDWREQSILMQDIYANGIINIGAAHAESSRAGLFLDRDRPDRSICNIHWRPFSDTSWFKCSTSCLRLPLDGSERLRWQFNDSPLFSRAWVLQERLLCRRMLYFGYDQIFWDCKSFLFASETWPFGCEGWRFCEFRGPDLLQAGLLTERKENNHREYGKMYSAAVGRYSQSHLTFPDKDKLVAFAGVGRRICELSGTEYCAGFPLASLPFSLCWSVRTRTGAACRDSSAPSWHWASSNEQIAFAAYLSGKYRKWFPLISLVPGHGPLLTSHEQLGDLLCIGKPIGVSSNIQHSTAGESLANVRIGPLDTPTPIHRFSLEHDRKDLETRSIEHVFDNEQDLALRLGSTQLCLLPVAWRFGYHRSPRAMTSLIQREIETSDDLYERGFWECRVHGLILSRHTDRSFRREGSFNARVDQDGFVEIFEAMQQTRAQMVIIR